MRHQGNSSKRSNTRNKRPHRSTSRRLATYQYEERTSSPEDIFTDDEDDNDYVGRVSSKSNSSKRLRHSKTNVYTTSSINKDIFNNDTLDHIVNVRRNKQNDNVEYHIQVKKIKNSMWINSDRLSQDYHRQIIDFLEQKYI